MNRLKEAHDFYTKVTWNSTTEVQMIVGKEHIHWLLREASATDKEFKEVIRMLVHGTGSLWPEEVNDYCNKVLATLDIPEDSPLWNDHG